MLGGQTQKRSSIDLSENEIDDILKQIIDIKIYAIHTAVNFIAGTIAKCEFKTYQNNVAFKGNEYYLWNYQPNINQTAYRFKQEFISKLLLNNEVLIVPVKESLIIADSFERVENAINEDYFKSVTKKFFTFNRTWQMSEVLYYKLNNHNVKSIFNIMMSGYDEVIATILKKHKKSAGEKGILYVDSNEISSTDKNAFQEKIKAMFNERFKPYLESSSGVMHLFKGYEFKESTTNKSNSEINDLMSLINDSIKKAAVIYKIPPNLLLGDLAEIESVTNNFITFCIEPIVKVIEQENTRTRYGKAEVLKGNYMKIDITNIMHKDLFSLATNIDKLISSGTYCIDDIREKLDETRLNTKWSTEHFITKNYEKLKGGETD